MELSATSMSWLGSSSNLSRTQPPAKRSSGRSSTGSLSAQSRRNLRSRSSFLVSVIETIARRVLYEGYREGGNRESEVDDSMLLAYSFLSDLAPSASMNTN